ncbi:hypothetical protein GTY83_22315 [Streptomyces sp. SID4928]|uniref:hypothetical protein n=1 Tax=unclassified Streptomyces TaxID=2593676 RepID=UPI0001C187D7|nr:hypothetical protein [Streptomyces sp. ACT-1]EGE43794.1 hypothetical protein SACT1_4468 [Streptomyces sp. ACT-1]MYR51830.1 hypothetical protein [Streptomyces sp. SID4928]
MTDQSERGPEKNETPRMVRIQGFLEYPENLTPGKSKKGGPHRNLYDSQGRLAGHSDFIPGGEIEADSLTGSENGSTSRTKERDEFAEEIREAVYDLLAHIIVDVGIAATPRVKRWWDDQALPAIKSRWKKMPRRNRSAATCESDSRPATAEAPTVIEATTVDSPRELVVALDENRVSMSSTEARARFLLALAARAFSEEQLRIVSDAHIEDDDGFVELKHAVDELTPRQAADIVKKLEVNPLLLDSEALTELVKALRENEKINERLRLADPEKQQRNLGEH